MTTTEVDEYLSLPLSVTASSISPNGAIHSVAMWFAYIEGQVLMEAKSKSQKVANLRRDSRITVLAHDGADYYSLRGVMISGEADVVDDDPALMLRIVEDVFSRYYKGKTLSNERVEALTRNRVVLRIRPQSIASWDHNKLR